MKRVLRNRTIEISSSEDSDCIILDEKKNDSVIDLTRISIQNENYEPSKKIHKGKKVNRSESPKRRKMTASSALKTIDQNINKTKSSKSEKSSDPKKKYSVMDFIGKNKNNHLKTSDALQATPSKTVTNATTIKSKPTDNKQLPQIVDNQPKASSRGTSRNNLTKSKTVQNISLNGQNRVQISSNSVDASNSAITSNQSAQSMVYKLVKSNVDQRNYLVSTPLKTITATSSIQSVTKLATTTQTVQNASQATTSASSIQIMSRPIPQYLTYRNIINSPPTPLTIQNNPQSTSSATNVQIGPQPTRPLLICSPSTAQIAHNSPQIVSSVQTGANKIMMVRAPQNNSPPFQIIRATTIKPAILVPQPVAPKMNTLQYFKSVFETPPQTIQLIRANGPQPSTSSAINSPKTSTSIQSGNFIPQTSTCNNNLLQAGTSKQQIQNNNIYCVLCDKYVSIKDGLKVKGCGHQFCHKCMTDKIHETHNKLSGAVKCPYKFRDCKNLLNGYEVENVLGVENFKAFQEQIQQNLVTSKNDEPKRRDSLIPALLRMDLDFIPNIKPFDCIICYETIQPGNGIILYECLHEFCKACLGGLIEASEDFEVKCPADKCKEYLREREVKALVSKEVFEKHLQKSLKQAEHGNEMAFHCRTPDCPIFMEVAANVPRFICPSCRKINCIPCKAIHEGKSCHEYQQELNLKSKSDRQNEILQSEDAIKKMIANNQAMYCPKCSIPVMKISGCDFIKCTACKLGICWVTKKPRKSFKKADGSIVEGCKCREAPLMKRCHPNCGFCH